jgi:hypothetical protein
MLILHFFYAPMKSYAIFQLEITKKILFTDLSMTEKASKTKYQNILKILRKLGHVLNSCVFESIQKYLYVIFENLK